MKIAIKIVALISLFSLSSAGMAALILEDDFSSGLSSLWQTGWTNNNNVTFGSAVVANNGSGKHIDLDGARIRTSSNIVFQSNVMYRLSFDLANLDPQSDGRHRSIITTIDGVSGNHYLAINEDLNANSAWQRFSYDFLGLGVSGRLVFRGDVGNNMGLLLDNVVLESIDVSEPATLALLSLGILGLGFTRSRLAS